MSPRFSVLIPMRDAADTIEAAIASVRASDFEDFEAVVIDDGSKDDSALRVDRLATRDSRLRLIRGPRAGLVSSLNRGLEGSRGELIARFDADDLMSPARLELQHRALLEDPRIDVISGRVNMFPESSLSAGQRRYERWLNGWSDHQDFCRELFIESPVPHSAATFRRLAVTSCGGYRAGDWPEDYDLWLRLWQAGHRFASIPQDTLRWRQHDARLTHRDPRYRAAAFLALKVSVLCQTRLARRERIGVIGAGRDGRRLSRALEAAGRRVSVWYDIDPRKLGRQVHGALVEPYDQLPCEPGGPSHILVCVGRATARERIREALTARGLRETSDFSCVA